MGVRTSYFVIAVAALTLGGCAAAPLEKNIKGEKVDAGPGSLEAARRQLQGKWTLVSLETYPTPGGPPVAVKAAAVMTFDEYGNIAIGGRDATANVPEAANTLLNFSGRVVIDANKQLLALQDMQGNADPSAVFTDARALSRIRKYEFAGDVMTMSTLDAKGQATAKATWRRTQ